MNRNGKGTLIYRTSMRSTSPRSLTDILPNTGIQKMFQIRKIPSQIELFTHKMWFHNIFI
jgi:hypothetical protein